MDFSKAILRGLAAVAALLSVSQQASANYSQAQAAFAKRNFFESAPLFFQAYAYPKSNDERYKAEWGLGQSLEGLDLLYSASKYYSIIVRRGPKPSNPFFRKALEQLGRINGAVSLGQSQIVELFKTRLNPSQIPGPARGFYFHYLGLEAFGNRQYGRAREYFNQVPASSEYYPKAMFHVGVIATLSGQHSRSISYFERVRSSSNSNDWLRELANINIARVYYERKAYRDSIKYYAQIRRFSDNWLDALFESSWAFFLMQKHNNTLGNIHTIHSPFFINRFYPETYILQAITFLRLCRVDEVKRALREFKSRYQPVAQDIRSILDEYKGAPRRFFKLVYDFKTGGLRNHKPSWAVLDAVSRKDAYKEAGRTIRFSDRELGRLRGFSDKWGSTGLKDELARFLSGKKEAAIRDAGQRLYRQGAAHYSYLQELSKQTELINAELLLTKVDILREKLQVGTADRKSAFIGGLEELRIGQDLEYWPFQGEYWIDELGGYVYNLDSKCSK